MSREDKMVELVARMSEEKAKEVLCDIFNNIQNVGIEGYTDEKAYDDIKKTYKQEIIRPQQVRKN